MFRPRPARLTVKNLPNWMWIGPLERNVQCRLRKKLLTTATEKAKALARISMANGVEPATPPQTVRKIFSTAKLTIVPAPPSS